MDIFRFRKCSSNSMSSRRRQGRCLPSNRLSKSRLPMQKSGCAVCSVVISIFNESSEFFGSSLWPCPAHCHRGHVIRASETDTLRSAGWEAHFSIEKLAMPQNVIAKSIASPARIGCSATPRKEPRPAPSTADKVKYISQIQFHKK